MYAPFDPMIAAVPKLRQMVFLETAGHWIHQERAAEVYEESPDFLDKDTRQRYRRTNMRKLKLQMQITVDGFVAGPEGQLDWMTPPRDESLLAFINHLTDTSDTILLGRKMTDGFIKYWEHVVTQPNRPEYSFGQKMVGLPKVVFSKTISRVDGQNVRVENGPLVERVNQLKSQAGRDLIVYGGATFVRSLLENKLIDELNLFVNPIAIGNGMSIFAARTPLKLTASTAYAGGIVVNTYSETTT
jgi:dihydrofolate reductase